MLQILNVLMGLGLLSAALALIFMLVRTQHVRRDIMIRLRQPTHEAMSRVFSSLWFIAGLLITGAAARFLYAFTGPSSEVSVAGVAITGTLGFVAALNVALAARTLSKEPL